MRNRWAHHEITKSPEAFPLPLRDRRLVISHRDGYDAYPMKPKSLLKSTQKLDRDTLRTRIQILIDKWEPILGVDVREWDIKKLKTYWASVNERERLITFNEKLADMPDAFVEVIVVHELVHLLTDGHDKKFYALMDRHMPNWVRLHAKYADPLMQHN